MLKIGNLKLKSKLILAPMAGITDLPFRLLNRRFGAELAFVEMINIRSLGYKSRKTQEMLSTNPKDRPLGIQILGCEPDFILRALDILKNYDYDTLNFNAACPVKKVTCRGEGASLLKDPLKLHNLLKLVVKHSPVPVTVKIRTGWDRNSTNAKEVALAAQDAGVSALFIHGRTKLQGYSGTVDYARIKKVKQTLQIPVVASGDVLSVALARKMLEETGCDGLLVARGALGNPWMFQQLEAFLKNGQLIPLPDSEEIAQVMVEHLHSCRNFHGARNGVKIFHKFFGWYTRGFRMIRRLREKAYRAKTEEEMLGVIKEFRSCQRQRRKFEAEV
jgi:tRNA-dihydrouridine synthase B